MRLHAVLALLLLAATGRADAQPHTSVATCQSDSEIPAGRSDAAASAAATFSAAIFAGHADDARRLMSAPLAARMDDARLGQMIAHFSELAPYEGLHLAHIYRLLIERGTPARLVCGTVSNESRWVAVSAIPVAEQFHVVEAARTRNNEWEMVIWMVPENGGWRVRSFRRGVASMGGRGAANLLSEARRERDAGHNLNAALLYRDVGDMLDRGSDFQFGLFQSLRGDLARFHLPAALAGPGPYRWAFGATDYAVDQVQTVSIGEKLVLMITRSDPAWNGSDNGDADRRNRIFLDALRRAHPELSAAFGGLVSRLRRGDGGGYATTYEYGRGYGSAP